MSLLLIVSAACSSGEEEKNLEVTPLYPAESWTLTDLGVSFSWDRPNHYSRDEEVRWTTDRFQIQVAQDGDFEAPLWDVERYAVGHDESGFDPNEGYDETTLSHWRESQWMPKDTLHAGDFSWRIRTLDEETGPWSDPISFTVEVDHSHAQPIRPLSSESPLFSFDMYDLDGGGWGEDPRDLIDSVWDTVPADIQDYVALAIPHEYWGKDPAIDGVDLTYEELLEPLVEREIPYMIKSGGPDGDFQWYMPLALLERLYQENPSCLGVVTGENTWSYIRGWDEPNVHKQELLWLQRVVQLSARYGRYVVLGEGSYDFLMEKYLGEEDIGSSEIEGDYEWMSPDFIRNHADTIIWAPKNNIMWSYHHADSLVFGAWLSEMVTHLGLWSEAWYWSDAGYTEVFSDEYQTETDADFSHMPSALWVQMQLMSMSKGAVYYHFGGESGIVNDAAEYHEESNSMVWIDEGEIYPEDLPVSGMWDMHGHVMPTFQRYVAPFIEAVVSQQLIPTREDVLEEVHAAVLPGTVESSKGSFACYGDYAPLYRSTYGIENWVDVPDDDNDDEFMENYGPPTGCRTDLIPSSGRYYWLPILPHPIESLPDVDIDIFEVEDLVSSADVRRGLDGLYPERWTGTAHVTRVGRRVFITNGHENTDTMQDFEIPLESGPVESLCGEVQPHAYLVARHDADGMTIHANANDNGPYTDSRSTWLRLHTSRELTVEVHPTDTPIEQSWDEATGTLEIEVSHSHGAVDLVFR